MPPLAKRFEAQLLVDIIVWKPSRFSANQMAARAEHRRSGFSLMPFRVLSIVESSRVRGCKHPLARLLGEGGVGREGAKQGAPGESYAMLRRLGPHKGLSRVIGRPLYHVTLQHYSERVTSNIPPYRWLARFSFAFFG